MYDEWQTICTQQSFDAQLRDVNKLKLQQRKTLNVKNMNKERVEDLQASRGAHLATTLQNKDTNSKNRHQWEKDTLSKLAKQDDMRNNIFMKQKLEQEKKKEELRLHTIDVQNN